MTLASGEETGYEEAMKLGLSMATAACVLVAGWESVLAQQSPANGATGTPRGIRAVTRRTLMSGYGADASALFTAGGLTGFQSAPSSLAPANPGSAAVSAPVNSPSPVGGIRPDVRRNLEALARRGDPVAAAALSEVAQPASAFQH